MGASGYYFTSVYPKIVLGDDYAGNCDCGCCFCCCSDSPRRPEFPVAEGNIVNRLIWEYDDYSLRNGDDQWQWAIDQNKSQELISTLANKHNMTKSEPSLLLVRRFYDYWLSTLKTPAEIIAAYKSIASSVSGELKNILHETAQIRYLEVVSQMQAAKQNTTDEKLSTADTRQFLGNARFSLSCFSTTTPVSTLFQRVQQNQNIKDALEIKKEEVESAFKNLR